MQTPSPATSLAAGAAATAGVAIEAVGLRKRYGTTDALDGFDLSVPAGTVYGLLGPNGAGKTTAVRILATLLRFDAGLARVAGFDVVRQPGEVRARIGLTGQYAAVDEILSGRQNLVLFGRLYHLSRRRARERADELLDQFGLTDAAGKSVQQYSGGMRRRLDLAASLILAPSVLFLDEPTTGLDPRSRNALWDAVRSLVTGGATVLLTTQYLDEADRLADRVSVVDSGRVVATGTPDELKSTIGGDRVEVVVRSSDDVQRAASLLERVGSGSIDLDLELRRLSVPVRDRAAALMGVVRALDDAGIPVEDVALRRPTLDEAFLSLTGRKA
ncbi:ATP-binding cassette domain-containing protein [Virgisporangium aurantiacum]|uniref:Daunorubicin resistance protein DrrA family ABC transporter ATP-binding protein n=1 Tax=Virgisporangium aurantiacum TaxID=175570 RepID=A0A8J3ZAZ0_9ACTN|nr:ATP-binding cassette domain-containing protein [Virgisporangium aurantiacum]GIJ59553.1 daunorubicin resistance protein DrrA family ABC transporter ATP-binding protein [Virgisporangium aurantiacum]